MAPVPAEPPAAISSVPASIVVPPLNVFAADSISVPGPFIIRPPAPAMTPVTVSIPAGANTGAPPCMVIALPDPLGFALKEPETASEAPLWRKMSPAAAVPAPAAMVSPEKLALASVTWPGSPATPEPM